MRLLALTVVLATRFLGVVNQAQFSPVIVCGRESQLLNNLGHAPLSAVLAVWVLVSVLRMWFA